MTCEQAVGSSGQVQLRVKYNYFKLISAFIDVLAETIPPKIISEAY